MDTRKLRVCDENVDVQTLIREALAQVQTTYVALAAMAMTAETHNTKLCAMIAQAQAANERMLSTLRHPAGER